ncbi:hypothetical protein MKX01_017169 [Papaver californicum]|nr:hypothetical protein MKX01_017169 [Papaver californicum]
MPVARPEPTDARIIAHVDMDCFYVQVEQRNRPELNGLPTAVVQYNSWKGGGLIAVSYEALKYGVKRSMRGDEAKEVCPQINLVQVPVARGKADLNIYRNAGSEVISILARRGRCERALIDEVYLDLTDAAETMLSESPPGVLEAIDEEALKSHVLGLCENENDKQEDVRIWLCRNDADHRDRLLACGAIIVAELRTQVLKDTGFTCSAGVAHNKMLAKLANPMNKPAQQTVIPFAAVKGLLASLPIKKITWLWNIARGINGDEVEGRLLPKSHGCGKTFPGMASFQAVDRAEQAKLALEDSTNSFENASSIQDKQTIEKSNSKGTCSILNFFRPLGPSCSPSQQLGSALAPSAGNCSEQDCVATKEEGSSLFQETTRAESAGPRLCRDGRRRETWNNFNIEEIDPSVIDELPQEIQDEVRGWLRPLEHSKAMNTKGSNIAWYFLPAKDTREVET